MVINREDNHLLYRCPVCQEGLHLDGRSLKCVNRHSYDIAKEGYVNLLLANQKHSQEPGDNQKMVKHRRQFFAAGLYEPLSNQINQIVASVLTEQGNAHQFNLLDSGCGEGYFLHRLNMALLDCAQPYSLWGIDISKFAIKAAAKRDQSIKWAVASSYALPVLSDSVDFVLNVMAPFNREEFTRILQRNGRVLLVAPGPDHLFSLRNQIYETPQKHEMPPDSLPSFNCVDRYRVQFTRALENEAIVDLFVMTPYSWNASLPTRGKIMSLRQLNVEIDFVLTLFEKEI